ncbi:MAG: hypothetical protein ACHP8B_13965 [Terriglobales bacterium]
MSEILLALILLVLLVIAFAVFRVANGLGAFVWTYNQGQEEITEALWAKMGCSREEWRERQKEWRLVQSEQRHAEEKSQGKKP